MNKFEALPLPQKLLAGFLAMALLGGGYYFLVISDIETSIQAAQVKARKAQQKVAQLKKYESGELLKALEAEEAELKEQLAANKALLPEDERMPNLITSIKRQADERGLKILLIKREEKVLDDYVALNPVETEVEGTFPVVIAFFEALAKPGMRMMTVNNLHLEALDVKTIIEERRLDAMTGPTPGAIVLNQVKAEDADRKKLSPTEQFLERLDTYDAAVERMRVKASFTINAYSYTGKLLSAAERKKRDKMAKKRGR